MLTFLIALLAAFFLWEVAVVKVNVRLVPAARKRLFKIGGRFAVVALIIELVESTMPEAGLSPVRHAALHALLMAAVPEEFIKFLAVNHFGKRELKDIGPGIAVLLAVGTSLGFGVLKSQFFSGGGQWVLQAFTALPMDAIFGFTMGGFMVLAWRNPDKTDETMLRLALLVPIGFHFLFMFLLMLHRLLPSLIWPLIALPAVMMLEGGFALILTNHAVNQQGVFLAARQPVDPSGSRALRLAVISMALTAAAMGAGVDDPSLRALAQCAALPLVFTLDLGIVALARAGGYA